MQYTTKQLLKRDKLFRENSRDGKVPLYSTIDSNGNVASLTSSDENNFIKLRSCRHPASLTLRKGKVDQKRLQILRSKCIDPLPKKLQKHVIIAGGAVFQAAVSENKTLNDVDIFIVGVAESDVKSFVQQLTTAYATIFESTLAHRSSSSITLSCNWSEQGYFTCTRVQIVLRLYSNVQELLYGFDLPCAAMALYNGKLLMTELALYTLNSGSMIVDTGRRSLTFSRRLKKYNNRGVHLIFPYLDTYKIVHAFQHSYLINQSYEVRQATLKVKFADNENTTVNFVRQQNANTFVGYIDVSYVRLDTVEQRDYHEQSRYSSLFLLRDIENGVTKQPEAFLPVNVKDVTADIDIRVSPIHHNPRMEYTRFLNSNEIRAMQFDPIYKFSVRTRNPAAQWTTSFDPIIAIPKEWYDPHYFTEIVSQSSDPRVKSMFNILPFSNAQSNYAAQQYFGPEPAAVEAWYFGDDSSISVYLNMVMILIYQGCLPDADRRYEAHELKAYFAPIVSAYPEGTKGKTNLSECIRIVRRWIMHRYDEDHFGPMINAIIEKQMPVLKQLRFVDSYWKKLREVVTQPRVKPNSFRFEAMCTVGSQYPMQLLQEQASYFDIDVANKTRRQLCAELAVKVETFMIEVARSCDNPDDYDLVGDAAMSDTPAFLRWTRVASNGKRYCFNVLDMYKSIQAGVKRDPRGYQFTADDVADIDKRGSFLMKVLNVDDQLPFAERFATYTQENAYTVSRFANAINAMIPYSPMYEILERLPYDLLKFLVLDLSQMVNLNRRVRLIDEDKLAILEDIYNLMQSRTRDIRYAVREAMYSTIRAYPAEIQLIKDQIQQETLERARIASNQRALE